MDSTLVAAPAAQVVPTTLPMTESQRGLLVVDRLVPNKTIYNQTALFEIDPAVSPDALRAAIAVMLNVQPSTRLTFHESPTMHAELTPPVGPDGVAFELREAAAADFAATLDEVVDGLGRRPFDLGTGPLCRFALVRADDGSASTLVFTVHHLIGDGFSFSPLLRDLDEALTGRLAGAAAETRRAAREQALAKELAAQLRVTGSESTAERARAWGERLRQVPPTVVYPRPQRATDTGFTGERVELLLDETEGAAVGATCRRLAVNPFVFFTAAYAAMLARHAATATVVIGSPLMARRTVPAFDLCGFFVNTLPIAVDVDWDATADTHVGQTVRAAIDEVRRNVDVPFTQLVAHAAPVRSSNRNPIFSCMLAMQDAGELPPGSPITGFREAGNGTAKFDVWLGVTPLGKRWLLELEYDLGLVPSALGAAMLESLHTAVRRLATDGSTRLADLFDDASTVDSYRTDGFGGPASAASLDEWLTRVATGRADAPAIADDGRTVSYAELGAAVEAAAAGLGRLGVGTGDVVGLQLDTLTDTVTAMLAVLRRNAAYLPLDPTLPADRLAYQVDNAGCRLVLGSSAPGAATAVTLAELTRPGPAGAPAPVGDPAPAYVMYTSGSTGRPKGVHMGQRPLLNLTAWQIDALAMGPDTRFLQYAPLGFDVSFQEIVPTLAAGGTVVSREPADRRDFRALARRIHDTEVTHVYLPVAALRPLVQAAQSRDLHFEHLRYLCVSGEQLVVDDGIHGFVAAHPGLTLVNLYGPTETHAVTTHRLIGADPAWPAHVPIGRPLHDVAAYVVDATGHLAPRGVVGELYLGGACPADGYLNDPERTAAGFLPDRFAGGSAVVYRTGDHVLRDEDGVLVFLGRGDSQVKIRGYRVELGEIETAANALPGIRQAVAAARGEGADRELVLFVLPEAFVAALDAEALRTALGATLPGYMVPGQVLLVDAVPTTKNGKVDRDALLAQAERLQAQERTAAADADPGYRDDLERGLAEIWVGLLGTEPLLRDRSLLEYGAHSLTIFSALAEVDQRYGAAVPIIDFFRTPTIAALAGLVRTELEDDEDDEDDDEETG